MIKKFSTLKLTLLEILGQELILNNPYEDSLINLIRSEYDKNRPELINFYKDYRIGYLVEKNKNTGTYNIIDIENKVNNEFERIKKRVDLYKLH